MDTSRTVPVSPNIDKTTLRNNALKFTSEEFETSTGYPENFGMVAGDFDGAGLSIGALQYNLKSYDLQPIWKGLWENHETVVRTAFQNDTTRIDDWYNMLYNMTNANQIAWGTNISIPDIDPNKNNRKVQTPWTDYFHDLMITPEAIFLQEEASLPYHNNAELWYKQFGLWSRRAYALIFDISVQKGGISQAVKDRAFSEFASLDTAGQTSQWIEYKKLESILNASADIDVGLASQWVDDYRARKYSVINDGSSHYGHTIDPDDYDLGWYGYAFEWNTFQTDIYVVQSGDTTSSIATLYDTDIYVLDSINPLADLNNLAIGQAIFVPIEGTSPSMTPYGFRYLKTTFPTSVTNPFEINILANTTQLQVGKSISTNINPLYGAIGALIDGNLAGGVYWEDQSPPYEVIVDLGEVRTDVTSIELYFAYSHDSVSVEVSDNGIDYIPSTGKGASGNTQLFGVPYLTIPREPLPLPIPSVNILSISKPTISNIEGMNKTNITFAFDVDVTEYTVNVIGTSHDTGIVAHTGGALNVVQLANMTVLDMAQQTIQESSAIVALSEIVAEVDNTELYQEGVNRVNIYGKNLDGIWTNYFTE